MTKAKICGITCKEELGYAIDAGADAIGFVVEVEGSYHSISADRARDLISSVPVFTKSVIVISPKDLEEACDLARKTGADVLQIHGGIGPRDMRLLKKAVSQRLVAATSPGSADVQALSGVADAILLDTLKDGRLGGTGEVHDWSRSADLVRELDVPVILAGGLSPSNVAEAIKTVHPYAVDVSSGVETDRLKDPSKVTRFVQAVRLS
ncbi:MAG: phosphoribosylanthranilate isomerase [Methanotrichaceae archaeon]|nr:phosphoribosylanthranilate isomerase [Methanotrichaceae archaeon]